MFDRPQRGAFRAPEITHRNIRATVKWFNPTKGFGFVTPDDGSPDAFLHASTVQFAGFDALPDGATVVCDLSRGPKGPQVASIHSVDTSTASAQSSGRGGPRAAGPSPRSRSWDADAGPGETMEGTVKWFNTAKGFGFVAPENGGKDVFVHISAVERSGLSTLQEGAQVRVTVRQGAKGPEAQRVEMI